MSKLSLVIRREYLRRVSQRSFLLLTLLMPFFFAAMIFVPLWLSTIKGDETRTVLIIDRTGQYANLFENTPEYTFLTDQEGDLKQYRQQTDKSIFAILQITDDLLQHPEAATLYSSKQIPGGLKNHINNILSTRLQDEKIDSYNIENLREILADSKIHFNIQTIKWEEDGSEKSSSSEIASVAGLIMTLIIYMFIMAYGSMVMQGVMEEKTNRIVEIMISSVKPFDLMLGKIIGIGLVGLTQAFLWGIMSVCLICGGFFLMGNGGEVMAEQMTTLPTAQPMLDTTAIEALPMIEMLKAIDWQLIIGCFLLYFIGGYLLYSSFFAAIGSALSQQEDTQQFLTPVIILMIFSLYAGIYSVENPDGPLAFWCSMIPLTSPIVMMIRLPFDLPLWQILISLVLLYGTALLIVALSARIYRIGILMYGKKPSLREIIRWIKYK